MSPQLAPGAPLSAFRGLDVGSARAVAGEAHLTQSIRDILTTPIGSRVMRRNYGSRLVSLIDRPVGPTLAADVVAATAEALRRWEPRVKLTRVIVRLVDHLTQRGARFEVDLELTVAGRAVRLEQVL